MNKSIEERLVIVIPARYRSERLPGKPLAEISGKPMVQHVYERALQVPQAQAVLVATEDVRVVDAVRAFGGRCLMTSSDHLSGTDRLVEVMTEVEADVYINLQCDEPLARPCDIAKLATNMRADISLQVGTLCHLLPFEEAANPNTVKVVIAANRDALYFSRACIPYTRTGVAKYFKHVGIYAYRREALLEFASLPQPMIEQVEMLEQLRLLNAGIPIRVFEVEPTGPGVDTQECLERVRALFANAASLSTEIAKETIAQKMNEFELVEPMTK
jgi:3-deoxy-D-manno-octulosonate 8-phosphate phosphatase (KDO 8-P phosphatase)